jgi:hypothetical protein
MGWGLPHYIWYCIFDVMGCSPSPLQTLENRVQKLEMFTDLRFFMSDFKL